MKKFVLLSMVLLLASVSAFAAGSTSSTQIIAVVGASVAVTGDLPATTTVDVTATQASLGSVTITSNTTGSWTITVHSLNGGYMKGESLSNHYPFTVSIASISNQSLSADRTATVTGTGVLNYPLTAYYSTASSLGLAADTYKDTITITVATL
ncbi:MAG TPA: hypothetical protein VN445_09830 [Rectinemataceae bacterium]|nr:hypothetical protein [Rectinemataceae bacterium]